MPPQFDGPWLRDNFPSVAESMDRFIDKIKQETHGEIVGELEIVRIPLNLYRARNATSRQWHADRALPSSVRQYAGVPSRRLGDRLALLPVDLAGLRVRDVPGSAHRERDLPPQEMLDRYELYVYKQWLRVYMRSKLIKHNKDLLPMRRRHRRAARKTASLLGTPRVGGSPWSRRRDLRAHWRRVAGGGRRDVGRRCARRGRARPRSPRSPSCSAGSHPTRSRRRWGSSPARPARAASAWAGPRCSGST